MMQLLAQVKTGPVLYSKSTSSRIQCYRCGCHHDAATCPGRESSDSEGEVASIMNNTEDVTKQDVVDTLSAKSRIPVLTKIYVNYKLLELEVDTGASVSIIPYKKWRSYFQHKRLSNCNVKLKTVSVAPLCVAEQINGKMHGLVLLIGSLNLGSSFVPTLDRSWLDALFPS
ncbi:hypothetical protein PR048_015456 [Dryococelus australis]|uniref:Peptidase A2 domain-containing protein n=1 Tax=Dryococelus australis TaxID=614101 RepID=A0ABQ9HH99_9NEOP|nr:hypothetical protein PR048_015456 [Dryococelus australis]